MSGCDLAANRLKKEEVVLGGMGLQRIVVGKDMNIEFLLFSDDDFRFGLSMYKNYGNMMWCWLGWWVSRMRNGGTVMV